ncbi:HNH endonuclease [Salmonella enterica]|nr:HNH endonuclease [Salmonella enterica]EFR2649716.1 HNH endonuclease [Salmonella enterica]EFS1408065.1 HNH endonuclease [Salmonella enterica]EHQ8162512.1 HNH endonuclease [Salmonella enterica]EJZ9218165.1 HNH endonuclease [Salmonella enterica]
MKPIPLKKSPYRSPVRRIIRALGLHKHPRNPPVINEIHKRLTSGFDEAMVLEVMAHDPLVLDIQAEIALKAEADREHLDELRQNSNKLNKVLERRQLAPQPDRGFVVTPDLQARIDARREELRRREQPAVSIFDRPLSGAETTTITAGKSEPTPAAVKPFPTRKDLPELIQKLIPKKYQLDFQIWVHHQPVSYKTSEELVIEWCQANIEPETMDTQRQKDKILFRGVLHESFDALTKAEGTGEVKDAQRDRKVAKESGVVLHDGSPAYVLRVPNKVMRARAKRKAHPRPRTERQLVAEREAGEDLICYGRRRRHQKAFRDDVEYNCYNRCVITGAYRTRCEAAHLVPHARKGGASFKNGLLLRSDLHKLFDLGDMAINPENLVVTFSDTALAMDADLLSLHGKMIDPTRQPINAEYLAARWEAFNT